MATLQMRGRGQLEPGCAGWPGSGQASSSSGFVVAPSLGSRSRHLGERDSDHMGLSSAHLHTLSCVCTGVQEPAQSFVVISLSHPCPDESLLQLPIKSNHDAQH